MNDSNQGIITVQMPKLKLFCPIGFKARIWMDGKKVGTVRPKSSLDFYVQPGKHVLRVSTWDRIIRSPSLDVMVLPGCKVKMSLDFREIAAFLKTLLGFVLAPKKRSVAFSEAES
jgi:hypothetical protein